MLSKQFIQDYFHADFKGIDSLLSEVLIPIFQDYEDGYTEITVQTDKAKEMAKAAHIKTIKHVATLGGLAFDIKVFDVTLDDNSRIHKSRKKIQELVRQFVERFEGAFIVFHYEDPKDRSWRLSYLEKRESNAASTNAKRYTYLCGQQYPCRTLADRFYTLQSQELTAVNLEDAFSVETLSDEFFYEYRDFYLALVKYVMRERNLMDGFVDYANGDKELAEKYARDYIKKLMGRLVFIQFLQNKAWLNNDIHYTHTLFNQCSEKQKENFLDNVLEPLFFGVFNTPENEREAYFCGKHWDMKLYEQWKDFPYLNGGLFDCDELDKLTLPLPDYFFSNPKKKDCVRKLDDKYYNDACGIFDFFDRYNFTIDESDPLDREVGVDPEMLGKIFENLLEDNKDKGAFYTPKEIVEYMCREALVAYLVDEARRKSEVNKQRQDNFEDAIRAFVTDPEMTVTRMQRYGDQQLKDLNESLCDVKICDPAIGSGAFPMGLLNLLMNCRIALNNALGKGQPRVWLKKEIIQNNIYGVDIEKGAIDIARLRFWLSIVVDLDKPEALPNFDYKFMQGNSLVEQYKGVDLTNVTEIKKSEIEGYQVSMFEDKLDVYRKELHMKLDDYFGETDHSIRKQLREDINKLVRLELEEQHIDVDLSNIDISANDQFFMWHTWFADVLNHPDKQGFDIFIGNPPFIGEKGHKEIFMPVKSDAALKKYYLGKMDYFYFFFHLSLNSLRNKGVCALITTNYYPTAKGARKLRQDFEERANLLQLINFNEYKIFESALGQHNLITILEKCASHNVKCKVLNTSLRGYVRKGHVQSILDGTDDSVKISFVEQSDLYEGEERYIRMSVEASSDGQLSGIFDKMQSKNPLLGSICNVNTGLFTACDGVFIDEKEKMLTKFETNELERSLLKPLFKNSDVQKFVTAWEVHKLVIYHHEKASYKLSDIPNIYAYLATNKEKLAKRRDNSLKGALKRGRWDVMALPKIAINFEGPKIVAPQRSKTNTFGYNEIPWYASADVYFITEPKDGYNLKYVLGLLNSKLYYTWLYHKGKRKGESLELYQKPLSEIPIKRVSDEQQQAVVKIVDIIIAKKKQNLAADTSAEERKIDILVYKLYKLTYDEVKVIDEELTNPENPNYLSEEDYNKM